MYADVYMGVCVLLLCMWMRLIMWMWIYRLMLYTFAYKFTSTFADPSTCTPTFAPTLYSTDPRIVNKKRKTQTTNTHINTST